MSAFPLYCLKILIYIYLAYIINHSHLTVVFAQAAHIPSLLKLAPQATMLRLIVSLDTLEDDARSILTQWGNTCNIKVIDLAELEALGASKPHPPIPAQPDDIVSICYTSGTTGNPKGALLSHQSLALAVHSNTFGMELPDDAATLSYLPLAHIYEVCLAEEKSKNRTNPNSATDRAPKHGARHAHRLLQR